VSDRRSPRTTSDLLLSAVRGSSSGTAAITRMLPGWTRAICRQYGLLPGTVDLAHYAHSARRSFSSWDAAAFHYLAVGSGRGWSPRAGFSPADYRRQNPDVAMAGYEPFAHWLRFGREEGRDTAAPADPPPPEIRHLLAHRRPDTLHATVDVVVPVYGSRALALQAIDSVLGAVTRESFELVVVDDASPDPLLRSELRALADAGLITLMENERNVGFVGAVNRGVALHPRRDVVLLNSDARVFGDWLDRLLAALRTPRTATATPLSNAATILSYPATLCENRLSAGMDIAQWDSLCAAIDMPVVEIPTGVGFCMAVRRACLDQIGAFDQERFGRGYGEENDFCLRATAAGWRHVAATGLFVWHRGGTSFGDERETLVEAAQATIEMLHPGYAAKVRRFIQDDPLEPARRALDIARIRADPRRKWLSLERMGLTGAAGPDGRDVLEIVLVPDIPPYAGQYRLVPQGLGAVPNLPRCGPTTKADSLAALLSDLGIVEFGGGNGGPVAAALSGKLHRAMERSANGRAAANGL
jgi:GT2 family glycosyltransferase